MKSRVRLLVFLIGILTFGMGNICYGIDIDEFAVTQGFASNIQSSQPNPWVLDSGYLLEWGSVGGQGGPGFSSAFGVGGDADFGTPNFIQDPFRVNIALEDTILQKGNIDPGTGIDSFDYQIIVWDLYWTDWEKNVTYYPNPDPLHFPSFNVKVHETADSLWLELPDTLPSVSFNMGETNFTMQLTAIVPDIRADIFPTPVPEPSTMLLLGSGLLGLLGFRRKFRK